VGRKSGAGRFERRIRRGRERLTDFWFGRHGEPGTTTAGSATSLTAPLNLTGMPAVSVPCGFTSDGLPVGLTIAGRHRADALVLRVAYAAEQATTGGYQPPPIA
jgi:Asp-tRNA(Asn)/Glu-tRNA(Gln) amidotransferase A subunit family amidase